MLPANLSPRDVLDLGIHGEALAFRLYDRLGRRVQVPTFQIRIGLLKKDEKDHRKTLKAHRRALFGNAPVQVSEEEAGRIFGDVDVDAIRDKPSLLRALYGAIRFEEYAAYFYDKMRFRMPSPEARIFMEVLAREGRIHAQVLGQQIDALRAMRLKIDERGRAVEAHS